MSDTLDCASPMGMEDGTIPDFALKASSEVSKLQYKSKTLCSTALMKWASYWFAKCFSYLIRKATNNSTLPLTIQYSHCFRNIQSIGLLVVNNYLSN